MISMRINSLKKINCLQKQFKFNYRYLSLSKALSNKLDCILSTIGNEGSGKSTLTDALKKISLEKFKYSLVNDINYGPNNVVLSKYSTNLSNIVHIDCPGSENGMKNLISNVYANDFCIVVIDASKGIIDQTKEQIICSNHLDKKNFIIFINKTDLCDSQTIDLIKIEIKEFFDSINLELDVNAVFYGSALELNEKTSSTNQECIFSMLDFIDKKNKTFVRDANDLPKFSIRKAFLKTNKGTEVTGNFKKGLIKKGDNVFISGYDRNFRTIIQDIESFREPLTQVLPGTSASLLLKSVKRDDIERGMLIYSPEDKDIIISDNLVVEITVLSHDIKRNNESFENKKRFNIHARTFQIFSILMMDQEKLNPGETTLAKLKLLKSMPLEVGLNFIIKEKSTVGLGTIKEILPSAVTELLNKNKKK